MKDKFILDSSIWIELERKNQAMAAVIEPLIAQNQICLVDAVVAELLRGTKTQTDFNRLKSAFDDFNCLSTSWDRVAQLAFGVGRQGFWPPMLDLYIAQCAIENEKILMTQDKHFLHIAQVKSFDVQLIK